MTRHASLGFAVLAAALSWARPSLAAPASALDALDRRLGESCARKPAPRVRLFEPLKGQPDALKLPREARREATAGVFI